MIDETKIIHTQIYDDEHEEWLDKEMTIAEYLDAYTEEGCPKAETCSNAISRESIETYVREYGEKHNGCNWIDNSVLYKFLKNLPSVTPAIPACEDAVSRTYLLNNCVVDKITMPYVPVNKIKEAPPVTPARPKGKWMFEDGACPVYRCSNCHKFIPVKGKEDKFEDLSRLDAYIICPRCGADMKEGFGHKEVKLWE